MARVAATDPLEYKDLLDSDPGAFNALITELTVGETYFLRESGQFDFVVREVLPDLRRRVGPDLFLRAWSAGCASGEEAYSLAIVARESQPGFAMRVLGTDIAESRLAVARKAVYGEWSLRGVPEKIVNRYFTRTDHRVKVIPGIRSMVEFRSLNLVDSDWTAAGIRPGGMDLIFCRNVFIYLDAATVAHIAGRLIESLHEGGWLFLGASDPGAGGHRRLRSGSHGCGHRIPSRRHDASIGGSSCYGDRARGPPLRQKESTRRGLSARTGQNAPGCGPFAQPG